MSDQAVMAQHIDRIANFVYARIDEQFTGDFYTRYHDTDPVSRSLRALRRVVDEIRSRTVLAENTDPQLATAIGLALTFAWGELAAIAKQWKDHPDYLPAFDLLAHQIEDAPTAPETVQGTAS